MRRHRRWRRHRPAAPAAALTSSSGALLLEPLGPRPLLVQPSGLVFTAVRVGHGDTVDAHRAPDQHAVLDVTRCTAGRSRRAGGRTGQSARTARVRRARSRGGPARSRCAVRGPGPSAHPGRTPGSPGGSPAAFTGDASPPWNTPGFSSPPDRRAPRPSRCHAALPGLPARALDPMNVNRQASTAAAQRVRGGQRVESTAMSATGGGRRVWDLTGYQWTVVFAAWLGWGFDVFDGLLFNFVAPNCVPTLLGLPIGIAGGAQAATLLLDGSPHVGPPDRLGGRAASSSASSPIASGRTRTLMLTMLLYALGTALCAFAPNIWMLAALPLRRQPGHRRRVGGRGVDGRGGGAREAPRRGRRPALHLGARSACSSPPSSTSQSPAAVPGRIPEISWRYVFLPA